MTRTPLLWLGALALSTIAIAGTKTYDVVISSSIRAGDVQLMPGDYKVSIANSSAVFTDPRTRKSFTIPVTVENADKKYSATSVNTTQQGDTGRLRFIELGGTKTKLEFAQ